MPQQKRCCESGVFARCPALASTSRSTRAGHWQQAGHWSLFGRCSQSPAMSSLGSHPEFHLNGMVLSSEPGMWGIHVPWHVEHAYQEKHQRKLEEEEKKYKEMLQKKKVLTRLHRSFGKLGQSVRQRYLREGRRRQRHLLRIVLM